MAALLRREPSRWRSTQLALTLSLPPTNHWACGSFQTSTWSHGLAHSSFLASSAQKLSGSSLARCQRRSYSAMLLTWADAAKAAGGGKERVSLRTLVMCDGEDMGEPPGAVGE